MRFFSRLSAAAAGGIAFYTVVLQGFALPPQNVYVWQRQWTAPVARAVREHGASFDQLELLVRELTREKGGKVRPAIDWAAVRATHRPVGLVIRVEGAAERAESGDADAVRWVVEAAQDSLKEAQAAGVEPREWQIDYDCPTARLAAYREWIRTIRIQLKPKRLVITALPDWLRSPEFRLLAGEVDGYVLQVHAVDRPEGSSAVSLCDPTRARQWIEQAERIGRPFRVALPDYGYRMGFDSASRLVGLEAEGAHREWPQGTKVQTVMAKPADIAAVVQYIDRQTDSALTGIAWFRLPTPDDDLTWRWATLETVRRGERPSDRLRLELAATADGAQDLFVTNGGNGPGRPQALSLPSQNREPLGWDLTADWRSEPDGRGGLSIAPVNSSTIEPVQPGERRRIGWIRYADSPPSSLP